MKLSIVIPTLNEARYLATTLASIRQQAVLGPHELLVVDCGSKDDTVSIAHSIGVPVLEPSPRPGSRAAALNQGARAVNGEVLLFLDADSLLPFAYDRSLLGMLRSRHVIGGAFEFALDGPELSCRLIELINRIRYRIWPWYYGDQGVFVRSEVFHRVDGYPERRILESSDLCRALWRYGEMALITKPLRTSPRRFLEGGPLRVFAHDVRLWWLDLVGLPTEPYGAAYQANNHDRGEQVVR